MEDTLMKPRPVTTAVSKPYWDAARQHRLIFQRCGRCGTVQWPLQTLCRSCLSAEVENVESAGKGTVYAFSTVYRAPSDPFKADVPYTVAIVELAEGYKMLTGLVGVQPEDVRYDMPVVVTFEDLDEEFALPKFRPEP